jgi:hypothetical protein
MAGKIPPTEEEIKMQMALGTLPPEMQIAPCRYQEPSISKGKRKCCLCGEQCIKKGDRFYRVNVSWQTYVNICIDCSWLPMTTINRMITERKANKDGH